MSGPWEKYQTGPWTQYAEPTKQEPPKEESGFLRQVADVPLGLGRGAVTGVRMIADAFGAGSGASEALKGAEGYLSGLMSAQSKNDEKEVARILKDAEDKGMLDQVKAGFKAFSVAPVDLLSQGFGTAAPAVLGILGAKVLGAGALGLKAAGVGVGAGMGAGSIKGGIYEETKAALREAGIGEAKAEQAAIQAQEYGGKNLDQILLGAGLGAVGGRFGVESAARRIMTKAAGQQTAKGAAREVAEGAARTAVTESVPELLQGSQEQLAKNIALQREGFDVPTMRGVGSSGTLEALAGAGLGTVTGATEAGLRRQARGEADRILAEEEKAKAPPIAEGTTTPTVQEPTPEPYIKPQSISGTRPGDLLGEREDPLAGLVSGRRAAAEPVGEVPLSDDYAFLQREKQRLLQEEQTPQTKQLLGRINDQLGEVLKSDIERLRTESETLKRNREADAEATKTSVFGQEELPPVESRDVVVGNMELGKLQAREAPPVDPLTGKELRGFGRLEGEPQPMIPEIESEVEKLTKDQELAIAERDRLEKRTSGTSLSQVLRGTLRDAELSELGGRARQVGKNPFLNLKAPKGQVGSSMEDMVDTGKLNIFLPVKMRPGNPDYVNSESAEYVREKLRNNQLYTYETELAIQRVDNDIESIERQIQELLSDDDINKELQYAANEQRELDQVIEEPAAPEADRAPEQRQTKASDDDLDKRQAQLDREEELNQREARLLEERKRLEEERLKLERPTKEDVKQQEERKEKAPEIEEREQVRKESEAGAGQFELTREEGRQDTTGDIFNQPEPTPAPEPKAAAISSEQERKDALDLFKVRLTLPILPFRARSANKTQLLKPAPLTDAQIKEILGLASQALDLGLPPLVLGNVTAAGSTRMDVIAVMSSTGSLMIANKWKDSAKSEMLHTLIHELAHAVDTAGGKPSEKAIWAKAYTELQGWYTNSTDKLLHPMAYPFAPQFKGRVRPKEESFAQAFAYYFVSPVDLQTNAPEAYSQIQSIVERIQDGSQEARAAGTTKTSTAGIKIQPARAVEGATVQPEAGTERTDVSAATRLEDRGAGEVTDTPAFKRWFGDSKIVDLNGKPLVVYHGTNTTFENFAAPDFPGWFSVDPELSNRYLREPSEYSQPNIMPVYLSIKNPLRVSVDMNDSRQDALDELARLGFDVTADYGRGQFAYNVLADSKMQEQLFEMGYDGIIVNEDGVQTIAPVIDTQIKSATGNIGTFDPEVQDINAMQAAPDTPAFKRWFGDSKVVDENGDPMVVYHGTRTGGFNEFKPNVRRNEQLGFGIHFAADKSFADKYATDDSVARKGKEPQVYEVYLRAENPLLADAVVEDGTPEFALAKKLAGSKLFTMKNDSGKLTAYMQNAIDATTPQRAEKLIREAGYDSVRYQSRIGTRGVGSTFSARSQSWIVFSPTQIKSATGNIGTYDPDVQDINAMQANPTRQNIFGEPVLGTWSITPDPKMELQDGLIYKMLDKNIDVKRIIEAVKSTGKEIASKWNPYLQEELYHGRTANASLEFQDKEWLPLLKDMEAKGVTIGELEKYLLNRHAEDYNKLMAQRNSDRPEMQDGASSVNTADARKYLTGLDADTKAKYDELAARVDGITKGTRQLLADTGYEKAKTIKTWEEMFPNYVPLMREEDDFDYNFASFGTGRGFDVRRDFSRSAMGSKRNVVDIIGNVISARNQAIALTEKNRVAQAVYGLALEAPNPDFWLPINPDLAEVRQVQKVKENIAKLMSRRSDPNLTDDERESLKSSFDAEYKKLKFAQVKAEKAIEKIRKELVDLGIPEETINTVMQEPEQRILDPKKGQVVKRVNTKLRENDHVLATRIDGEKRYVFFNPKDPRAKRAATALKNLDAQDLGTALGMVAKVTRWMASVNTQYNPIFGPYNFLRDVQSAALQISTTELAGQQKEIAANVVPSLRAVYSSLRKRRKGEKVEGEMADLWKEFQKEGGQTGFKDNFSRTQDRTEALLDEMSKITEGKAKAGARAVFDWLSDYNDSLENAVRLSAYKVAKEKFKKEGSSDAEAKQRAASLAKNLTVNFNRKGDVATQMGALYAFFNASMQGTARMIETLKGPMGKKIMAGGLLLGGMQAALLAAAGFDEDEPPEFIRSKNIVIPTGDGDYFAFPMPLGFHVIPGISRILTEWTLSGFNDTAKRVTDLTGLFLDAFNPIGNAGWSAQTLAPTFADPIVALFENKDWTGKPISKEDLFSLRPTPGYTRARDGANWLSTNLAEFLNLASGGTKHQPGVLSPTPEQIEYLVGQVFGGVGREAVKLSTSIEKTATGEDLPPYKIPLYGRFFGETKSTAAESNRFYKNMERLNRLDLEVKGRREDREPIGDFMRENPEARLLPLANKTYKDVQELRKRRAALLERDAPKESIQAVEKMITRKMQVLNDRVKAMQQ